MLLQFHQQLKTNELYKGILNTGPITGEVGIFHRGEINVKQSGQSADRHATSTGKKL